MKNIIAATAAGLVMFFWGFVSWTILPWHQTDVHSFVDEAAVMQVLVDNAPKSGMYFIPSNQADYTPGEPSAMANVLRDGSPIGMVQMMVQAVIAGIVMAYIAILLLAKTQAQSYAEKVTFITTIGLLIGLSSAFMYWNWFGFPTGYSVVMLLDNVVTWLLAGLVIGKLAE